VEILNEAKESEHPTANIKDYCGTAHALKVRKCALALANVLSLPPDTMGVLADAALLHDIGKIGVRDRILNKKEALTEEEFEEIKLHPQTAGRMLANARGLGPCVAAILFHHERYDGKGYPRGLKGEEIPLEARILGLADALADMTSNRPYKPALSWEEAVEEVSRNSGTQFDPQIAKAFLDAIDSGVITRPVEDH
jgi:HD-GYP domain-containing protein (c-di-GMP phosphodiesterase class II)